MKKLMIGMMVVCSLMALSGAAWCRDNVNGTVTVNGLVWLKDAGCLGYMKWNDAMARPKSLAHGQCELTDKSKAGDWRLPTVDELKAVYPYKGLFKNVQPYNYWSSTSSAHINYAWYVIMYDGYVGFLIKDFILYVWPVRSVQ